MSSGAGARLERLLSLVPYLLAHQGALVEDVAEVFGVSERTLVDDLQLLFVCGLPGHLPDDLIEADLSEGRITVGNADTIARPLRLTPDEALTLLVGLRALADLPGLADTDVLLRTLTKLERAAGEAADAAAHVRVALSDEGASAAAVREAMTVARRALAEGRSMHLTYYVPGRDETTERDVDPLRLLVVEGHPYLQAWCHRAEGVRTFRLDRVLRAGVLDAPVRTPPELPALPDLFTPSADDVVVVLEVSPQARWVAEYYPCQQVDELPGGRQRVLLRTPDAQWVRRLVLRLGGDAVVVAPVELAADVEAEASAAVAAYAGTEAGGTALGARLPQA